MELTVAGSVLGSECFADLEQSMEQHAENVIA
jgi:hypothetical protein